MGRKKDQEILPAIRRARYDRLTLIEISEDALDRIERGSPDSIFLNFSIFYAGVFASFLIALLSTEITPLRGFTVFVLVAAVSAVSGAVLFALWWRSRRTVSDLIARIRKRVPPEEGVQVLPPGLIIPVDREDTGPPAEEPGP